MYIYIYMHACIPSLAARADFFVQFLTFYFKDTGLQDTHPILYVCYYWRTRTCKTVFSKAGVSHSRGPGNIAAPTHGPPSALPARSLSNSRESLGVPLSDKGEGGRSRTVVWPLEIRVRLVTFERCAIPQSTLSTQQGAPCHRCTMPPPAIMDDLEFQVKPLPDFAARPLGSFPDPLCSRIEASSEAS